MLVSWVCLVSAAVLIVLIAAVVLAAEDNQN